MTAASACSSPAKKYCFALILILGSLLLACGGLLVLDIHLHNKFGEEAGFNYRGYRGPVAGRKQPGETRIVVLGGSTALGYGVKWRDAMPAQLERSLNDGVLDEGRSYRVINLAWNNEGAFSYEWTLRDYAYLDYDIAVFYSGYNDLGHNLRAFRRESPIFRLTGYLPIFPLIFREKAMALKRGGDIEGAYRGEQTAFKPNLAERGTAAALETAANITQALEDQLGHLTPEVERAALPAGQASETRWSHYCASLHRAIDYALHQHKKVIVVTQPYLSDVHVEQQSIMMSMLKEKFPNAPNLVHVHLGDAVDLKDTSLAYDGLHLTVRGNENITHRLLEPVRSLAEPSSI